MTPSSRAGDWLRQAQNDLAFARTAEQGGFHAQCCFICQQTSEKAMKALLFQRGARLVLTHSLVKLCQELEVNSELQAAAARLDQYYLAGRYPDALPGGAPFEIFSKAQAVEALDFAQAFVRTAETEVEV